MTEQVLHVLDVWVVYGPNTIEYPGRYVTRCQTVLSDGSINPNLDPAYVGPSLDEARQAVPPNLIRLNRDPNDDPAILESWI